MQQIDERQSDARDQEEALIGAVLRDGSVFEQVREIVKPEHFKNWSYSQIWLGCEHLFENGLGIDALTVGDELERMNVQLSQGIWSGRQVLTYLRSDGDPANALSYAENVQDHSIKRGLDYFFQKCAVWSKNGRRSKDILKDVSTELGKIAPYSVQDEYTVPISEAVSEAYDLTDKASRGEIVGIRTPFTDLNNLLGCLHPSCVYIVAARPSKGKTAFLTQIALEAAKKDRKALFFSLEMSRAQVAQRLISMEAEIDLHEGVIQGHLQDSQWPMYVHVTETISALPLTINDLSSININQIRQTSRKIGPDIIFLDYIQLADSGQKRSERRELDVSEVSRGLKYLARELNVPVVAAAQLSRDIEKRGDKRPILSDLRESGSLEQDAYSVLFIHELENNMGGREIIVAKHRNGPTGSVTLAFRPKFAKFGNAYVSSFNPNEKE